MNKKSIYQIELSEVRQGAPESALRRFERESDKAIPAEYRRFLNCQDGGRPRRASFKFGTKPYQDSVLRFFLGVSAPHASNLRFVHKQYTGRIPQKSFPIAVDQFDNLILVSGERGSPKQILFWDHEAELRGKGIIRVAESLRDFLRMLEEAQIMALKIATITFEDGATRRRVLPFRFFSLDKEAAVEVAQLVKGERVRDSGTMRVVSEIRFSTERHSAS